MDALTTILLGTLITGVTQAMKKVFPTVQPLFWVALLAITGGFIYGIVLPLFPTEVVEKAVFSFTVAIGLYETLKAFAPSK